MKRKGFAVLEGTDADLRKTFSASYDTQMIDGEMHWKLGQMWLNFKDMKRNNIVGGFRQLEYVVTGAEEIETTLIKIFSQNFETPEQMYRTLIHETGHVFADDMGTAEVRVILRDFLRHKQSVLAKEFIATGKKLKKISPEEIDALVGKLDDYDGLVKLLGDKAFKEFTEYIAETFVKYVRTGKAPTKSLEKFFQQFKQWLANQVRATFFKAGRYEQVLVKGQTGKAIPPRTRAMIDEWFAETPPLEPLIDEMRAFGDATDWVKFNPQKWQDARQLAQDEAEKWYYKEFTDYTNQNIFDRVMKAIYPFWTYESQRWLWAPRSFMRRPLTWTTLNRWNENTDMGYIDIPGIPIDINPFRGTIYGPFTTTLMRGNFPHYYDALPEPFNFAAMVNDGLNHYGFYPGVHASMPLAIIGGVSAETGELLPPIANSGMSLLQWAFPKSDAVQFLTERIFPNRFRNYLISVEVAARGHNGQLLMAKIEQGKDLTEEEEDIWYDAARRVSQWNIVMEQAGMFRYRPDEYTAMKKAAKEAIYEVTGVTPLQQEWLNRHGYRLWEVLGGMTLSDQMALESLDYFAYPRAGGAYLGPSKEGDIQQKLTIDWDDVEVYNEEVAQSMETEWARFLNNEMGVSQLDRLLIESYSRKNLYIENKIEQNPMMDWEYRLEHYEKTGQSPPVRAPIKELVSMWYQIELEYHYDDEGVYGPDWEKFWAERAAIESAVPEENKDEWFDFLTRNMSELEILRRQVNDKYFTKYYDIHEVTLAQRNQEEQELLKEYYSLVKRGTGFERREEIRNYIDVCGDKLVSSFERARSANREALRVANPYLDAWLAYWQKTTSLKTEAAKDVLQHLFYTTGRKGFARP